MENRSFKTPKIAPRKRPTGLLIWSLLMLGAGTAGGWFAHDYLLSYMEDSMVASLRNEISTRDRHIEMLGEERDSMRQQAAALERAAQIDKSAMQQLKEEIKDNQAQRLKLEEELIFLRGVVSKDDEGDGLRIRNFRISQTSDEGSYRYRFTVTQVLGERESVNGQIVITLKGQEKGKNKTLTLADISADQVASLKMGFKHFQDLEGILKLPAEFTPKQISIQLTPEGEQGAGLTKEYDWVVSNQ